MNESKHVLGSDLDKLDAHVIQPEEYEEIPELTDEWFAKAEEYEGGKRVASLPLDADVLAAFRATGHGWQTRANAALRDWLNTHSAHPAANPPMGQ
jgi:uncharacterized protein (DUF4415 family)